MKVPCGKQVLFPGFNPSFLIQALAFGAVAIAAGVIGYPQGTAMITLLYMTAKLSRAAGLDGPHGPQMPSRHLMAVSLPIPGTVAAKDIRHLKGAAHEKPPSLGTSLYEINGAFYLA